jgi:hypothetical protein
LAQLSIEPDAGAGAVHIITSLVGLPFSDLSRNHRRMTKISHSGYRFPPEIIQQAIWLYVRFTLATQCRSKLSSAASITACATSIRRLTCRMRSIWERNLCMRRKLFGSGSPDWYDLGLESGTRRVIDNQDQVE